MKISLVTSPASPLKNCKLSPYCLMNEQVVWLVRNPENADTPTALQHLTHDLIKYPSCVWTWVGEVGWGGDDGEDDGECYGFSCSDPASVCANHNNGWSVELPGALCKFTKSSWCEMGSAVQDLVSLYL